MKILKTLALTCFATSAIADTTLIYNDKTEKVSMKMQFANNMMRATTTGDEGGNMIYDANKNTFIMLVPKEKQYFVMDEETVKSLTDIGAMMEKMMEKQLANVPEAQREMMRNMMAGAIKAQMPKQMPAPEYSLTGKSESFNGFSCQIVLKKSGRDKSEYCVTEYSALGMDKSEYETIAEMQKIIESLAKQFGTDSSMNFMELGSFIPVNYRQNDQVGTLSDVNHDSIDPSLFTVPADYKEIDLPFKDLQ